jgi:hypothetical protein
MVTTTNKFKTKEVYKKLLKFDDATHFGKFSSSSVKTTGEPKNVIRLNENKGWKLMWTRSHVRKRVRTLADSGCSCTIFTDRNLFTDYQPYSSPISTAGGTIRSTGRGTVGLQNCLCVPEMNINLISTGQVLKQIPTLRFILEDGVFIIQDKTGRNADMVYENVQDLCEITDLKWLGVEDDSDEITLPTWPVTTIK